eukprot:12815353-Heterocapsa_arctica.AAC.1
MLRAVSTACAQNAGYSPLPVQKSCCPPCGDGPQSKSAFCCSAQGPVGPGDVGSCVREHAHAA